MVTALTADAAVLQERLAMIEILRVKNGTLGTNEVDNFRRISYTKL